jgi:hypothetical protein
VDAMLDMVPQAVPRAPKTRKRKGKNR